MPYDPEQVDKLIKTIGSLELELVAHKKVIVDSEKRSRYAKKAAVIGLGVAIMGIFVGLLGYSAGNKAQKTADDVSALTQDINEDRGSQVIAACVNYNVQRAEVRAALKLSLRALAPVSDAELTERQRELLAVYNAAVDAGLPFRDCSPAGIAKYFEEPPADPATIAPPAVTVAPIPTVPTTTVAAG